MTIGFSGAANRKAPAEPAQARRRPLQERSQDRVQRILQAAAALVDTMPLDAITMAVIAKAAGASFSSIYRFFPSKEAIFEDVVIDHLDKLEREYENFFARTESDNAGDLIDNAIDLYVAFVRREIGFKALWLGWQPTQMIVERFRENNRTVAGLAMTFATARLGIAPSPELDLRVAMAMEASTQLLRYAFTQRDFEQDRVIGELKRFLKTALLMLT